jgi:predicted esterase
MLQLIDHGYDNWGIDRNAVYAVGHSRGAGMTAMLAIGSGRVTTVAGLYVSPFAAYCVNAGYDPYSGSMGYSTDPKRPVWVIHGSADSVVPFAMGEELANGLTAAGWDVTWTPVTGGSHTWLFQSSLGQTNQDLWDFFASHPLP